MNNSQTQNKPNPGISACMIVKNEENFLTQCLKSIQDYIDEIIIVDTGSQDKTIEIAESFGVRIYHHKWEDHFSKHRNQSFSYAKMDWIFYIDADEELLPGSGELLIKSVAEAGNNIDAIAVTLECIFNEGNSMAYNNAVRLFRNNRGFYYKGRVHNYIVGVKNVLCYPIRLFHHGYNLDKAGMARKFERTTKLLKMDIADNPDDPRPHHFLSASYLSEHMYKEALEEALLSITLTDKKNEFSHNYLWTLYMAASASLNLGNIEKARELAEKGIKLFPDHLDSYYILAMIAYERNDSILFDQHFNNYLRIRDNYEKNPEKFGEMVHNTLGSYWVLHLLKAFLLLDTGSDADARHRIDSAMDLCPDHYELYIKLGNYYLKKNRFPEAETTLLKAKEIRPENLQSKKLLVTVYEMMRKDAELNQILEECLKIDGSDPDCLFSLGLLHMKRSEPQKALNSFNSISEKPYDIIVLINMSICLREIGQFQEVKSILTDLECDDVFLKTTIYSNLAFSFWATGDIEKAIEVIQELEKIDSLSPYPPILMSRIFLDNMDIEACVHECSRLLSLLGIIEDQELNSIEDLARCYLHAARGLKDINKPRYYIQECLEIALILAQNAPSIMVDIGSVFIDIGLLETGSKTLKKALLQAPSDSQLKEQITTILHP